MNREFLTTAFNRIRLSFKRRVLTEEDSEDALQEAFCRLWSSNTVLPDTDSAEGMLYVTSRNILIDKVRKRSVHPEADISDISYIPKNEYYENSVYDVYSEVDAIMRKVLIERDREILILHDRDEWDYEELSNKFGLSEGNLRMIVSRSRKKIREIYRKRNETENYGKGRD